MTQNSLIPFIIARVFSGEWLIEPSWPLFNADQLARVEEGKRVNSRNLTISLSDPSGETIETITLPDGQSPSLSDSGALSKAQANSIQATVSYIGPVYKYGYFSGSKIIGSFLQLLAKEKAVSSVRLLLDSPGGEVAGTRELYQIVASYPKPVLAVVDGLMASAAYYLGSGAQQIVATQPTDRIGSIGTMCTVADIIGFYRSIGLDIYQVFAPDSTEKGADIRKLFDSKGKDSAAIEASLKVINDQFLADVKAVRPTIKEDSMKGAVYYSTEAQSRGLIDDVVPLGQTLQLLADMQISQSKSTHNMSLFSKMKALLQEEESQSESPTAEERLSQAQSDLTETKSKLTQAETELSAAQNTIQTLTSDRDEWKAKAESYGSQPGDTPTKVKAAADKTEDKEEKTLEQILAELPSERAAAEAGY